MEVLLIPNLDWNPFGDANVALILANQMLLWSAIIQFKQS